MKRILLLGLCVLTAARMNAADDAVAPTPRLPTPSARQMKWEGLESCGFMHFSMNTFTGKEWGYGDESPDQIATTAAEAGMKGLILTCKHHDGFCLWPSKYTEHSVKNSPWKDGKGDVVREMSDACRRHGLKFGIYLSPWDRNRADYGRPSYITYYRNQLRELLTGYGPIFEVWFDGANGGDGYYGGARETRTIDRTTYYDWSNTWSIVRELQPDACMFSDGGPDIRWVGNEDGHAGVTCWATLNRKDFMPGQADSALLNAGERLGTDWLPAECDVSIRPGWFYHAEEDDKVKSVAQLLDIYFASVGRGAGMLLNIPPDRRGQIAEPDVRAAKEFHQALEQIFAHDLAQGAKVEASNVRGKSASYEGGNAIDGRDETYWATDDGVTNAELVLTLTRPATFNIVKLREYLPLGQRVEAFALDQWKNGEWSEFAAGASIGNCRLERGAPVTTEKVRLRIVKCDGCPAISELGLFSEGGAASP
jgi:alpha-L-fucosidase